jgi:prolyl oligopeptidase
MTSLLGPRRVPVALLALVTMLVVATCVACTQSRAPRAAPASPVAPAVAVPTSAAKPERTPPVAAPRRPVVHSYFGTAVTDDYEWLEDGASDEVRAFTTAQNALARTSLDAIPERPAVHERVAALLSATSPDWLGIQYAGGRLFALKEAPPKQQRMLVVLSKDADPATERVVLDPNTLDPSGKTAIDFFVPSADGRIVAVSLSKGGTESGDLHLLENGGGAGGAWRDRDETIARVNGGTAGGSVAWNADGTGFHYTRYPRVGERDAADLDFYQQVYFHKLGTKDSADVLALGKDFPRIAEVLLARSDDGQRILAHVSNGDGGEVEHHIYDGGRWARLSRFEDEIAAAAFGPDGKVYAVARSGAPRGKVVVFAPPFGAAAPTEVLPEGDAVIEDVIVTKNALYAVESADGPSRVRRVPLLAAAEPLAREASTKKGAGLGKQKPAVTIAPGSRGHAAALLPVPAVSSVTGVLRIGDDLMFRVESYVEAPTWMLYRSAEHRVIPTALRKKPAYDMRDVEVVRETCVSKDGTHVPMSVLRVRGAKQDGTLPAYLTGYGGFGITIRPRMRGTYRVWLDRGGVVAEANLRGGGERGEAWHRAGNLTKKQNVFDDFAACAQALFDLGYTKPERLAISGRSNGGLLMGAALVQHPSMFRAVASGVGIYDMLRSELSSNGAFNVTEYGSVKDEAQFRALRAYSPLHNVKQDTPYPAVLFVTGANDSRVDPYHSRKMAARLQSATSSGRPILLRASGDTGHGMGTPLAAEIEETTDVLAFLLHEVGP